ncbi:hypothetical protein CW700_07750 [Candidatus Bathyarchaeota archaeon]|nr:MAG: hypothetical protein CW700_07750 [Candidatus Bathyarchaeota archaeon]
MVRYGKADEILCHYVGQTEYGGEPSGAYTTTPIGYPIEIVPQFDPELRRVFVLRSGSYAGEPIRILSGKESVKWRITWLQPDMGDYGGYVQKCLFTEGKNLWLLVRLYRDASNNFQIVSRGLKCSQMTVRGSIGEPIQWTMELVGMDLSTPDTLPGTPTFGEEPTGDPWDWDDCYLEYDAGGGMVEMGEVTDFEFRIETRLKPVYVFKSTGAKVLDSLEEVEVLPSARITANLTSEEFLDYLVGKTEVDLRLNLGDGKYIQLNDGRFRAVEPTINLDDLIAQRLDFQARTWSHNFT